MRERCNNPRNQSYSLYGNKGVFVCKEWSSFGRFQEWALSHGYADDLSIDRKDVDGPYHPDNCRWATLIQQANNKTSTLVIEAWGEEKSAADWARDPRCAVQYETLRQRIVRLFWEPERAISEPSRFQAWRV